MVEFDLEPGLQLSIVQEWKEMAVKIAVNCTVSGSLEVFSFAESSILSTGSSLQTGRLEIEIGFCDQKLTAATSVERTDEQIIAISTLFAVNWWDQGFKCRHKDHYLYAIPRQS
ncbi:hypothetical protein E4U57_002421 [Claviceps arundinis]|uniref:Uncharacterized protein n=1 Tax=Claviceps arundinis TaxID=1623583 RepID=A0ABQ7PNC1_9HYPO|nr:hypothetical protein E4U57_002421 [Claviceps arundinis]